MIKSHVFQVDHGNPINEICDILQRNGFEIYKTKPQIRTSWMKKLYREHEGKPFYDRLIRSVSGPLLAFYVVSKDKDESHEALIHRLRTLVGATNPEEAAEGTLRKRFGTVLPFNAVHCSDSVETAQKELVSFSVEIYILHATEAFATTR